MCLTIRGIFTISTNMTDDAYARPSFKKGFRRHTTDQKPHGGWNAGEDDRDDLVRLFGLLGGSIIETLLTRESATIADVATITGAAGGHEFGRARWADAAHGGRHVDPGPYGNADPHADKYTRRAKLSPFVSYAVCSATAT